MTKVENYVPNEEDWARVGSQLTAFTLSLGGPDYKPESYGFKAVANEVTKGELIATTLWGRMEVNLLIVKEEYRKQGIGHALLQAAEEYAKQNKVGGIHLWTPSWQGEGFYEKEGYEVAVRMPFYLPDSHFNGRPQTLIYYRKELDL